MAMLITDIAYTRRIKKNEHVIIVHRCMKIAVINYTCSCSCECYLFFSLALLLRMLGAGNENVGVKTALKTAGVWH